MKFVRCAVRALVVRDGQLLTIQMSRDKDRAFYILPGGGQLHGENLRDSLARECREEIEVEPQVGELAYVREYIGRHHGFRQAHRNFHQLEVVFHATLPPEATPKLGMAKDKHQIGVRWIPLEKLAGVEFYPAKITDFIVDGSFCIPSPYLGDIN